MILKKPPMGWNTWNTFGHDIDEKLIMDTADKIVELGYKDVGYEYVIIDDCWSEHSRDENGKLVPDKKKFPHGMKYIADYIHSKGLKFGMYSDAGFWTCAGYPASYGHEITDANTFAEWEIDYLKYDFGFFPKCAEPQSSYLTMAQALRLTGRDIVLAACTAGRENPGSWARSRGCHTYRSTDDIRDCMASYRKIFNEQSDMMENNTFDCFNDLDMLTVGMYGKGHVARGGMTYQDYEIEFLIWSFFASPLIIGGDIRTMDEKCKKLLQNKDIIAINQDKDNRPAFRLENLYGHTHVFARLLSNNDVAVLAINFSESSDLRLKFSFDDVGIRTGCGYGMQIKNVLTNEEIGTFEAGYGISVKCNSAVLLRAKIVKL